MDESKHCSKRVARRRKMGSLVIFGNLGEIASASGELLTDRLSINLLVQRGVKVFGNMGSSLSQWKTKTGRR